MDEFCSAIRYSNQRLHVDRSENTRLADQVGISRKNSWRTGYQDNLICPECRCEEEGRGVASSASQCADSSISGSADEATDDRDNSVFYYGLYVFSYSLNARCSQWVGVCKVM